jgi:hypothetical protein
LAIRVVFWRSALNRILVPLRFDDTAPNLEIFVFDTPSFEERGIRSRLGGVGPHLREL